MSGSQQHRQGGKGAGRVTQLVLTQQQRSHNITTLHTVMAGAELGMETPEPRPKCVHCALVSSSTGEAAPGPDLAAVVTFILPGSFFLVLGLR